MILYLIKRLLLMIPLLIGITVITFGMIHLAPGEPVEMQIAMNPKVTAESRERLRKFYGLDKPLYVQYALWVKKLAMLDFGRSFAPDNRPVADKIAERIPVTLSSTSSP
jgi:peptide/nickel transport system permease protein